MMTRDWEKEKFFKFKRKEKCSTNFFVVVVLFSSFEFVQNWNWPCWLVGFICPFIVGAGLFVELPNSNGRDSPGYKKKKYYEK